MSLKGQSWMLLKLVLMVSLPAPIGQVFWGGVLNKHLLEIEKNRSTTQKQPLGGSFFKSSSTGSTPSELQPLVPLQTALTKAAMNSNSSATPAISEYEKLHDPHAQQPTPPVQAARLSQLLKTLANAESSVSEVIKSRRALIDGLEKLLAANRSELAKEEALVTKLTELKEQTDTKKREVEDAIMRGFTDDGQRASIDGNTNEGLARPEPEALTPPPVEAITPVGSPKPAHQPASHGPFTEDAPMAIPEDLVIPGAGTGSGNGEAFPDPSNISPGGGNDFDLSINSVGAKRRKVTHGEEDYAQFATGDLDADVAELIAQQGK